MVKKPNKALNEIPILVLQGVTYHMGSLKCYLPPDTSEHAPP